MLDQALLQNSLARHLKDLRRPRSLFIYCFQWSSVRKMHYSTRLLAILALSSCAGTVVAKFHDGYYGRSRLPRAPSSPQRQNLTTLPSFLKYASYLYLIREIPFIHALGLQTCTVYPHRIPGRIVRLISNNFSTRFTEICSWCTRSLPPVFLYRGLYISG